MSEAETIGSKAREFNTARNYAFILFGLFFWPLLLVAYARSSRARSSEDARVYSHAVFQYQTSSVALVSGGLLLVIFLVMIFGFPPTNALEAAHARMRNIALLNVGYIFSLWAAVRSIRGLYLAGARETLSPTWLWTVWPKPAVDVSR